MRSSTTLARSVALRVEAVQELATLLLRNGRWWLLPMLGVLLLTAILLFAIHVAEYVAPFVYSIF